MTCKHHFFSFISSFFRKETTKLGCNHFFSLSLKFMRIGHLSKRLFIYNLNHENSFFFAFDIKCRKKSDC